MRVLIVRHASAVERGTPGVVESERALTARGRRRFRPAARGLAALMPRPDALLSSPLRRARQTATLLARAWGAGLAVRLTSELAQGDLAPVAGLLRAQGQKQLVALVGHEPYLSALIAQLVGAQTGAVFALRKGGAALLDWDGSRRPARLLWLLPPKLLRLLA